MTDLELLIEAAKQAGDIARGYFGRPVDTQEKPDDAGPVTEADLAVNAAMIETLRGARPDYGWLSEETDDDPDRLTHERCFIVDPIDGTRSFIAGNKTWGHALAIAHRGTITAAACYFPIREELFAAALGQGATKNGQPISVSPNDILQGASVLTTRPNLQPHHWAGDVPHLDMHMRPSLAYRLCAVAEGRFDASFTFRPTWEWDAAAGALIVEEAGGVASDRTGAKPRFNQPSSQLDGLIVAPKALHCQLRDKVAYGTGRRTTN